MPARSPEERALISRLASRTRLAKTSDWADLTVSARNGLRLKFEREALDANPGLTPEQLERSVTELHRAHMLRMSLKAAQARRRVRENTAIAEASEAELAQLSNGSAA